MAILLSGDVGGTHTRLDISRVESAELCPIAQSSYLNAEFASLTGVVQQFLSELDGKLPLIDMACFAVAGPIEQGQVKLTNLHWHISEKQLEQDLPFKQVHLLNDFEAVAFGIDVMTPKDLSCLHAVQDLREPQAGLRTVVGAGTGLGMALLTGESMHLKVYPTEGGHIDFAPIDEEQHLLLSYLKNKLERVSIERVCSGYGLVNIYHFVRDKLFSKEQENESLAAALLKTGQGAAVIANYAMAYADPLAQRSLDIFIKIYGSVLGNAALMTLPYGGLYIAGGIAEKLIKQLRRPIFMDALHQKGRMSPILKKIPVYVVLNSLVGLYGARCCAMQLLYEAEDVKNGK